MIELLPKSLAKKRLVSVQMAFTLPMFECCSSLDCISPQLDIRGRAPLRTTAGNHLVIRIIHGSISSIASVIQTRGTQLMHPHTQAVPFEPTGRMLLVVAGGPRAGGAKRTPGTASAGGTRDVLVRTHRNPRYDSILGMPLIDWVLSSGCSRRLRR